MSHLPPLSLEDSQRLIDEQARDAAGGGGAGRIVSELDRALGRDTYSWKSEDGEKIVTYGRPKGVVASKVARILGPAQAMNDYLQAMYRAFLSIRTLNGDPAPALLTSAQFDFIEQWFGSDENLVSFMNDYMVAMNPTAAEALQEARDAGMSPEDQARIASNAQVHEGKA